VPAVGTRHNPEFRKEDTPMKIVRFSQNGHAPRLGCFLGADRIADLEASAAPRSSRPAAWCALRSSAAALFPHDSSGASLEGRQREPGHADRHDGRAPRSGKFQPDGATQHLLRWTAARPIEDPGEVHCTALKY